MKIQLLAVIAICFFAIASGYRRFPPNNEPFPFPPSSTGPYIPERPKEWLRVRRFADPQGSITLQGQQPLSGPDRRPSLNLDYNQRIINNGRTNLDAYGGATWQQGSHVTPHAGMNFEHHFGRNGNGFVGGFGQVQPGPRGHMAPSFGVNGGFRFRRDLQLEDEEIVDNLEE